MKARGSRCSVKDRGARKKLLYVRRVKDAVIATDLDGKLVWDSKAKAGRLPISPTEANGTVYVCSNRGLLTAIDPKNGETRWQYQVTPQLYVMAGIAAKGDTAYACGFDGVVTAIKGQ